MAAAVSEVTDNTVKEKKMENMSGRYVIDEIAKTYPQLYLRPDDEGRRFYPEVVLKGKVPLDRSTEHFIKSENDRIELLFTPAGEVVCVTLYNREDFEIFYQIMGCKCRNDVVSKMTGAAVLDGVVNWGRINSFLDERSRQCRENNEFFDKNAEFKRFVSLKSNYCDYLILLSTGGYSGLKGESFGIDEEEWKACSVEIRKAHECTHYICRKKYPDLIDPVWDEIAADAVGILSAFGHSIPDMECVFLGVSEDGYTKGRLENYSGTDDINETARRAYEAIYKIDGLLDGFCGDPLEAAVMIEEKKHEFWDSHCP